MKRGANLAVRCLLAAMLMFGAGVRAARPGGEGDPALALLDSPQVQLASASTRGAGNPFAGPIVGRNAFGLNPIPPPPVVEPPAAPLLKVQLTAIANFGGTRKAVLNITDPTKPASQTNITIFVLAKGQREKEVEVLDIDMANRTVRIKNRDTTADVPIEEPKLASAPAMPGMPMMAMPGTGLQIPGGNPLGGGFRPPPVTPAGVGIPAPNMGATVSPLGVSGVTSYGGTAAGGGAGSSTSGGGLTALPTRTVRASEPSLTPEQQMAAIELERIRTADAVRQGKMPPLPPTPLSPSGPLPEPPTLPAVPPTGR